MPSRNFDAARPRLVESRRPVAGLLLSLLLLLVLICDGGVGVGGVPGWKGGDDGGDDDADAARDARRPKNNDAIYPGFHTQKLE
jgi:hypothetical protein